MFTHYYRLLLSVLQFLLRFAKARLPVFAPAAESQSSSRSPSVLRVTLKFQLIRFDSSYFTGN